MNRRSSRNPKINETLRLTVGLSLLLALSAVADDKVDPYYEIGAPEIVMVDEATGEVISDNRPMNEWTQKSSSGKAPSPKKPAKPTSPYMGGQVPTPTPGQDPSNPIGGDVPTPGHNPFDPLFPGLGRGGQQDPSQPRPSLDDRLNTLGTIINLGLQIWDIVVENRPITKWENNYATAVPSAATDWRELEYWEAPRSILVYLKYRNLFGAVVVDFSYRILYTYGGKLDGVGLFLTNATIVPHKLKVSWGYSFDAKVDVPSVVNVGSKGNPVAGMEMLLRWTVSSAVKEQTETSSYFIKGDGTMKNISNGN